jgi:hypothetical protein
VYHWRLSYLQTKQTWCIVTLNYCNIHIHRWVANKIIQSMVYSQAKQVIYWTVRTLLIQTLGTRHTGEMGKTLVTFINAKLLQLKKKQKSMKTFSFVLLCTEKRQPIVHFSWDKFVISQIYFFCRQLYLSLTSYEHNKHWVMMRAMVVRNIWKCDFFSTGYF